MIAWETDTTVCNAIKLTKITAFFPAYVVLWVKRGLMRTIR